MNRKPSFQGTRRPGRSFAEILEERRAAPPKDPAEATATHLYLLAREMLRREVKPARREQVLGDFEEAARALVDAATAGATWAEQAEILQAYWERFELPEGDLRKRREERGPADARLVREIEVLRLQLKPILRDRKKKPNKTMIQALRPLAPWATKRALGTAALEAPTRAACVLLGSRYKLAPDTIRNRISKAKKRT